MRIHTKWFTIHFCKSKSLLELFNGEIWKNVVPNVTKHYTDGGQFETDTSQLLGESSSELYGGGWSQAGKEPRLTSATAIVASVLACPLLPKLVDNGGTAWRREGDGPFFWHQ